jgi:iron complex transport system ATP-binding protein
MNGDQPVADRLAIRDLQLGYRDTTVIHGVTLDFAAYELSAIVGPNGSGKSTLLRGMGRLLRPAAGEVRLDGRDIRSMGAREIARCIALLPQAPDGGIDLTVEELVWRGRYPHRALLRGARATDVQAVEWALDAADVITLRSRLLGSLSGGERQRAWIALALAQQPQILLLDEPTTFLDLRHQVEVMSLLERLRRGGTTIVVVLHDLVLASRYADRVIGIADGRVAFDGPPAAVMTEAALEAVFDTPMEVLRDPRSGRPIPLPISRSAETSPLRLLEP